jgi:hypothetical protein
VYLSGLPENISDTILEKYAKKGRPEEKAFLCK